jgi:hypothetical protein
MKPLPQNHGILAEEPEYFGARCFSEEAVARFPELAAQLTPDAGSLHLQMGTLGSATRVAIETGNAAFFTRVFNFLSDILTRPRLHPEVENAVALSFLTPADLQRSDSGRRAWLSLPERLKHALQNASLLTEDC